MLRICCWYAANMLLVSFWYAAGMLLIQHFSSYASFILTPNIVIWGFYIFVVSSYISRFFSIFKIEFYVSGSVSVIGPHSDGVRLHLAMLLCPLLDIQDLCQPYKMECSPASPKSLIFASSLMLNITQLVTTMPAIHFLLNETCICGDMCTTDH
jgi:hypothetical protein